MKSLWFSSFNDFNLGHFFLCIVYSMCGQKVVTNDKQYVDYWFSSFKNFHDQIEFNFIDLCKSFCARIVEYFKPQINF